MKEKEIKRQEAIYGKNELVLNDQLLYQKMVTQKKSLKF